MGTCQVSREQELQASTCVPVICAAVEVSGILVKPRRGCRESSSWKNIRNVLDVVHVVLELLCFRVHQHPSGHEAANRGAGVPCTRPYPHPNDAANRYATDGARTLPCWVLSVIVCATQTGLELELRGWCPLLTLHRRLVHLFCCRLAKSIKLGNEQSYETRSWLILPDEPQTEMAP